MKWLKISGISGILVPSIAFTLILLAITYSPEFSWTENALSDLGIQEGMTAHLFNNGLIISGVLTILFATGLLTCLWDNLLSRMGALVLVLDAFALTAIGIFPEDIKPMHFYASVAFFTLSPISMFFIGTGFLRTMKTRLGLFTFIVAIVAAVVWAIPFGRGAAIPETLSALCVSVWSIILGLQMLKGDGYSKDDIHS